MEYRWQDTRERCQRSLANLVLETKPRLELNNASVQSALRLTEQRITRGAVKANCVAGIRRAAGWQRSQVQLIEDVEEVGAEFKSGILSQDGKLRKPEGFLQRHIGVEVTGSPQYVPSD
jgi:hypothetical protein